MTIKIGCRVFVEQAWEDDAGNYHDELAEVISLDPLRLRFLGDNSEANSFCEMNEYTLDQLQPVD